MLEKNKSKIISKGELLNGGALSNSEILSLSHNLSFIYIEIIDKLSLSFSIKYSLSSDALKIILRSAVVPITHCFFERLIRLNKIVNASSIKPSVSEEAFLPLPNIIEDFQSYASSSIKFNQSVVVLLSEVWGLKKIPSTDITELDTDNPPRYANHLFSLSKTKWSLTNVLKLISRCTEWIPALGRFPVLSLSYSTNAFHKHFFYLKNFKNINSAWAQTVVNVDFEARDELFNKNLLTSNKINKLLDDYDFSSEQQDVIAKLYLKFIKLSFPLQFLEGLQNNFQEAQKALSPFKVSSIFYSSNGSTRPLFVIGVAKSLGFKIINLQHGGHYGYLKGHSGILEMEWPSDDVFLTWGWMVLPNHPAISKMQVQPLPSPWLSERKLYWQDLVIGSPKAFDVLWMPNKMNLFTFPPQGASSIRKDIIKEFSGSMVDFITNAAESKIKVFCKPFNPLTLNLMADTFKSMELKGGDFFECSHKFDKGMSYELLEKCQMVLWDQPGTGFLECITSGIPTMILWTRIYCEEEEWCKDDFIRLEEVGVIHRTSESLVKEIQKFLVDPLTWMNDKNRKEVIKNFTNIYALSDDKWWKSFHNYLKKIKKEV